MLLTGDICGIITHDFLSQVGVFLRAQSLLSLSAYDTLHSLPCAQAFFSAILVSFALEVAGSRPLWILSAVWAGLPFV